MGPTGPQLAHGGDRPEAGAWPPGMAALVEALRAAGWSAAVSGVMPGQLRTEAPLAVVLEVAGAHNG